MVDLDWKSHFSNKIATVQAWYESTHPRESLLYWSLRRGAISFDEFSKWAQSNYHFPILDDRYFLENPRLEYLSQCRNLYSWNKECMPVAQWNGITYVACLLPPQELISKPNFCFVLASMQYTSQWWEKIKPYLYPNQDVSDLQIQLGDSKNNSPEDPSDVFEKLEKGEIAPLPPTEFTAGRTSSRSLREEVTSSLIAKSAPRYDKDVTSSIEKSSSHTLHPVDMDQESYLRLAIKQSKDHMNTVIKQSYSRLKKYYSKCMVWVFDGDKAVPLDWEQSFTLSPEAITRAITLEQPSIFRIVFRSHKPYHGYIVPNAINQNFLNDWNQGQLPETITLAPIKVSGQLSGFILAFADKDIPQKPSLQLAERTAKQISTDIMSVLGLTKKTTTKSA